jgi:hypothetical protein
MNGSAIGIIILIVVVAVTLPTWLWLVFRAQRHPSFKHQHTERWHGKVRGSLHKGNTLSPRRDEPVDPDRERRI